MSVDCGLMVQFTAGATMAMVRVRLQLVHSSGSEPNFGFHLEFVLMIP